MSRTSNRKPSYKRGNSRSRSSQYRSPSRHRRKHKKRTQVQKHSSSLMLALIVVVIIAAVIITTSVTHKRRAARVNEDAVSVSEIVLQYESAVDEYAAKYGIKEYKEYLLAIIEVETGGYGSADVMQSSESIGLSPGTLQYENSIEQGCAHFAECVELAQEQECDLRTAVQSYNYGKGFVSYVAEHGGEYSLELAEEFAAEQSGGQTVSFEDPIAVEANGGWRYRYGNMFYVPMIEQYVSIIRELE